MKLEHTVEVAHFENSTNPRPGYHYAQVTVKESCSFEGTHDHPESKRVDEVNSAEIKHQTMTAFAHLSHHVLTQLGSADDIKFSRDSSDRPRPLAKRLSQVHPRNRI